MSYTLELCDYQTDTLLADLTGEATFTVKPRRSGQPTAVVAEMAADSAFVTTAWTDGFRYLTKGIRSLKVRLSGTLIEHVLVWRVDYTGDENTVRVTITGYDPLVLLATRPYRDATGNLIDPTLASPISGAEILKGGIDNSVSNSGGAGTEEGFIPIDTTLGVFDTTIPPAADLGVGLTNWPINLDEVVNLLAQTGAVDIWLDPCDTTFGTPPGVIGILNVANRRGSDISGTVVLEYGMGADNIKKISRSDDMTEMINKLFYYLGPKQVSGTLGLGTTGHGWKANITASIPALAAYDTLQLASRAKYGYVTMRQRVFDDNPNDAAARPLYTEVWKAEVVSSVDGQEIIKVTPTVDCAFQPYVHYMPGDSIGLSVDARCGPALSGAIQRVDGFDVAIGLDGAPDVSEIQTLQDS